MTKSPSCRKILDKVASRIRSHIAMSDEEVTATTLWIAHTHLFELWRVSPRLCVTSPEPGCGKTSLLLVLRHLVRRPLMMAHATPAAIFRQITDQRPTLLFDEADASLGTAEMLPILNSGFQRDTAFVIRAFGQGTVKFATWSPAAFAVLKSISDSLESRSIVIELRRKRADEITTELDERATRRLKKLRKLLRKWAAANLESVADMQRRVTVNLENRVADIWKPLFAIATLGGRHWARKAKQAARTLTRLEQPSVGSAMLADIYRILTEHNPRMPSTTLASQLAATEDARWTNFERRGAITPADIAKVLRPYRIAPKNMRFGQRVQRGYRRSQFTDAFDRYLGKAP